MANYTDNPSMDEILKRIKKALAEREERVEREAFSDAPVVDDGAGESEVSDTGRVVSFEEVREFSKNPDVSNEIVQSVMKDEIFIKPNLSSDAEGDVFVLTKDMKISDEKRFKNVDFSLFAENFAKGMTKDLAIGYLAPKVESWIHNNFWEIVSKSKK